MKKLKKIIRKHWGIKYKEIDKNKTLIELAEEIACKSEDCTIEEAYSMWVGHETLHLPGLISIMIIDDLGLELKNFNCCMTISEILES